MECKKCDKPLPINNQNSQLYIIIDMARIEAENDKKVYVVVQDKDRYYHDCLNCRIKNNITDGTIIAYIR